MHPLEEKISYSFSRAELLKEALTHPSLSYESRQQHRDNQRLEYLGDAVVQLVLTDRLYHRFPRKDEGKLTQLRSRLVSRDGLCQFADRLDLGQHLLLGKGEEANGGRERPSNLADAFEALAGAVYLDGGLDAARRFLVDNFADLIDGLLSMTDQANPKGELQERLQSLSPLSPTYEIISQEGPDHLKTFVARVSWDGRILATGSGTSKKEAETAAASAALASSDWHQLGRENSDRSTVE